MHIYLLLHKNYTIIMKKTMVFLTKRLGIQNPEFRSQNEDFLFNGNRRSKMRKNSSNDDER